MANIQRRSVLPGDVADAASATSIGRTAADTASLSDIGGSTVSAPAVTIFEAREIITLDPSRPVAQAVAVVGGRILATGSLEEVEAIVGDQPRRYDSRFSGRVIVAGCIAQHDNPVPAALDMSSGFLSIEDWVLPTGTVQASRTSRTSSSVSARQQRNAARRTSRCWPGATIPLSMVP
ncbi:hypothetical protein [Mangrovicoccus sp. HB161399]|uniref:hypothetical protein n=1 Tax=Mangrovicoccus sp. HB161399 TaxID=2720392 RepID=UPI0020A6433E|nr:hypothetical protein [Mangrovicoccus sp. HB161399]